LAKLIKILAASVGGGLLLGAGIRLGEAIAAQIPVSGLESGHKLAERLGDLENRLLNLEGEIPAAAGSRPELEKQTAEVAAERTHVDSESGQIGVMAPATLDQTSLQLRGELRNWLEESVNVRMAEVETRLRTESERGQRQMLDAFAETVQTRVIQRISKLEEEVAGQSAAMSELRECSLRTEHSVHKLLGGLDKLIVKNPPAAEEPGEGVNLTPADAGAVAPAERGPIPDEQAAPAASPEPPPVIEPPAFEARPKSRRWKIFG
jgi:hypothetical protein